MKTICKNIFVLAVGLALFQVIPACGHRSGMAEKPVQHISDSAYLVMQQEIHKKVNTFTIADSVKWRHTIDSLFASFPYVSKIDSCIYYLLLADIEWHGNDDPRYLERRLSNSEHVLLYIRKNKLEKDFHNLYVKLLGYRAYFLLSSGKLDEVAETLGEKIYLQKTDSSYSLREKATDINNLITLYFRQEKYNKALELCREIFDVFKTNNNNEVAFFFKQRALDDIGLIFRNLKMYDSSLFYHFAAEDYIIKNRGLYDFFDTVFAYKALMNVYSNIATDYILTDRPDSTIFYCNKALALRDAKLKRNIIGKEEEEAISAELNTALSAAWFLKGDIKKAESAIDRARNHISLAGISIQLKYLKIRASIDSAKENYKERIKDLYQYKSLKERKMNEAVVNLSKDPEFLYTKLLNDYELEKKNQMISLQQAKTKGATLAAIIMLVLTGAVFFTFSKHRQIMSKLKETMRELMIRQKQKEEEELRYNEIRFEMKHQEAIAGQRREISNNLHDSLSGSLVALRYYIEDLRHKESKEKLKNTFNNIGAEVETIYLTTRQYMHDLNAGKPNKQYDLPEQLEELAKKFGQQSYITIELKIDKDGIRDQLEIYQQDQLYYIINEAVSNTLKYAGATTCIVSISFKNGICFFSVSDNGKGFENSKIKQGLGLSSMHSRIKKLKGRLKIHSGNKGTTIDGQVPVQQQTIK